MLLIPGTRIGSYEVLSPLGAGGMGEVYRANDSHLGRDVALKTLPEAFLTDPERVARFEREARILAPATCFSSAAGADACIGGDHDIDYGCTIVL